MDEFEKGNAAYDRGEKYGREQERKENLKSIATIMKLVNENHAHWEKGVKRNERERIVAWLEDESNSAGASPTKQLHLRIAAAHIKKDGD